MLHVMLFFSFAPFACYTALLSPISDVTSLSVLLAIPALRCQHSYPVTAELGSGHC